VAELDSPAPISATTQLLAIAWLRWHMFANSLVRRSNTQGRIAGLIATILLRLIVWSIFAMMAIGPAVACGLLAWRMVASGHPERLISLLAGVAIFWQFVAVNGVSMAATLATFDPTSLLRFPLRFGRYLVLRLALGLLTPSTVVGSLALFAAALGIGVADHALAPAAFLVLGIYAAMNLFFSRMIAVWLERWLATRRAREIFGMLMAAVIVGVQFFNFRGLRFHRPTGHPSTAPNAWLIAFLNGSHHFLKWLPPAFAANSIALAAHPLAHLPALLLQFTALLLWTAAFFTAFALRLHRQFLGEYLSEGAPRTAAAAGAPSKLRLGGRATPAVNQQLATINYQLVSPAIAACLRKEWVYLRGNGGQLVAMLTPLVFVFLLARGVLAHHPAYLLSGAVGYAMLGLLAGLYNTFGFDGAGVQLYLLAPVRLRDVILAKNITALALLTTEAAAAWCLATVLAAAPIPLAIHVSTFFWIVFMLFSNLAFGTLRSIQSPRKVAIAQARRMRNPSASKSSGLLVLAILLGSMALQVPVTLLCRHFHNLWLGAAIFAPLAAIAVAAYALLLSNADRLILTHRDTFAHELCSD
jgi:ABC-2 type transport system permease protein